jgi:hypothetical protein
MTIGEVSAVEVYPLMLDLLRIDAPLPATGRDGLRTLLEDVRRVDARH